MLYKINKKLFIWLLFFVLLPLENVCATTVVCPELEYSPDYTYVSIIIALVVIVYMALMIFLHIFIKNKILLIKVLVLFLTLLSFLFLNFIFSSIIGVIIITIILFIMLVWIISYISVENKVLFLKAIVTLIALSVILFVTVGFDHNKEGFNAFIKCKKSGGVLREGVCKTYCDFVNSDSGKSCNDNNDCEGYCEIENYYSRRYEIRDAWHDNFPNSEKIKIDDWNDKTKMEMKGECNEFKSENKIPKCVDFSYEIIGVEGGFVKRIDCIPYYEWEFR